MVVEGEAHEHWNGFIIFVSFALAFMGSYSTVCLAEQYRIAMTLKSKLVSQSVYLALMSVTLGGCAIWSMHFVGMSAIKFHDSEHNDIAVTYDIFETLISLITCVICVYGGLYISSRDKMFSRDKEEIFKLIVEEGKNDSMAAVKSKHYLMKVALFRGIGPLVCGGVIAGGGVCIMHYLGMLAVHADVTIHWNVGIVAASVLIAVVAATAAFWILFRLLALFPTYESLRLLSSLVAAIAVCGMHYTGMLAASYTVNLNNPPSTFKSTMDQTTANILGLAIGVFISWGSSMAVQAELRSWHVYLNARLKEARKVLTQLRQTYNSDAVLMNYETKNKHYVSSFEVDRTSTAPQMQPYLATSCSKVMPLEQQETHNGGVGDVKERDVEKGDVGDIVKDNIAGFTDVGLSNSLEEVDIDDSEGMGEVC